MEQDKSYDYDDARQAIIEREDNNGNFICPYTYNSYKTGSTIFTYNKDEKYGFNPDKIDAMRECIINPKLEEDKATAATAVAAVSTLAAAKTAVSTPAAAAAATSLTVKPATASTAVAPTTVPITASTAVAPTTVPITASSAVAPTTVAPTTATPATVTPTTASPAKKIIVNSRDIENIIKKINTKIDADTKKDIDIDPSAKKKLIDIGTAKKKQYKNNINSMPSYIQEILIKINNEIDKLEKSYDAEKDADKKTKIETELKQKDFIKLVKKGYCLDFLRNDCIRREACQFFHINNPQPITPASDAKGPQSSKITWVAPKEAEKKDSKKGPAQCFEFTKGVCVREYCKFSHSGSGGSRGYMYKINIYNSYVSNKRMYNNLPK